MITLLLLSTLAFAKYPDISPSNSVYLDGTFTEHAALVAGEQVMDLSKRFGRNKKKPIYLIINTKGGSLLAGKTLALAAEMVPNPVHTVTCFSAGTGFNLVQRLGTRYVAKNGVMVALRPKGGFSGTSSTILMNKYERVIREVEGINLQNSTRMGVSIDEYTRMIKDELWLTGQEAVDKGAADQVISQDVCKEEL